MKRIVYKFSLMLFIGVFAIFLTMGQQSFSVQPAHYCPPVCTILESPTNHSQHISVTFPDEEEIFQYLNASGEKSDFKSITNNTEIGTPFNYQISVVEKYQNIVWLAFLANHSGQTDIYIQRSNDSGHDFPSLAKLSNASTGIPSELQLDTSDNGKLVYLVWESYTPSDNKTRIWVSSSLDAGNTFRTYSLNVEGDGNGYDPVLKVIDDDILIVWTQDPPMHCFGPHGHNNTGPTTCVHGSRW